MVGLRQDRATRPGERKSRQAYEVFRRQKTQHLVIGCYGEADLWLVVAWASLHVVGHAGEASKSSGGIFRCARPSGVPRGPATSTGSLASQI